MRCWRLVARLGSAGLAGLGLLAACASGSGAVQSPDDARFARARQRMVDEQLRARDITDERVLAAMARVPRHLFVPEAVRDRAYDDRPLPIGYGQTISQPYIVAYMTQALELGADAKTRGRVLEIGTGSGYQAAVLAELVREVYTIEIIKELAERASATLAALGYTNVVVRHGDGYLGWPERAPFDGILVTAAPDHVPQPLVDQLAVGGRLVLPVGRFFQEMTIVTKTPQGLRRRTTIPVLFVPMTGGAVKKDRR
jgi:protein-L-isoaspartate(D-aspartate) O-methyltransferase